MNRTLLIAFLFFIIGCNANTEIPKGILPPQEMQYVMWDMIQADGLTAYSLDTMMRKPAKRMELYGTVLNIHKMSQATFRKNIQFYESRPDLLKIVFDSLQQMALRDTATIVVKPQKATTDTAKKVTTDSIKRDTAKGRLDSIRARKLPIEKMKALKIAKPV